MKIAYNSLKRSNSLCLKVTNKHVLKNEYRKNACVNKMNILRPCTEVRSQGKVETQRMEKYR